MVDLLAGEGGASADELTAHTGWQRHSVLGALSRLRTRGFHMQTLPDPDGGGRIYQLSVRVPASDAAR